ncbi:polyketide cyclase [Nocardioides sp. JQ2195]|uniref:SRPBCC family protein n=1 Tax=Nocardioides sp. JQ2195 TaxID=2592334 RepID=UPI00143E907A|nr:SRPBCC family protein [Nocardioides sp. JQ2195]QIX25896.1 polyketide cyclase [Nocardioides sp. JQ2195]
MSRHFRFGGEWLVDEPHEDLHDRLVDLEHYPDWWPEVRAVASLGDDDALVVVRSRLPYDLELHLHAVHRRGDLLETTVDGDLVGWVRWRMTPVDERRTRLAFEQEVEVAGRLLGLAAHVARPLLVWNHNRMMGSAVRRIASASRA